jgi:hypothetical protein
MTEPNTIYLLDKYVQNLSEKELKAYHIAKSHLGSSFSLEKSRGFIDWKKKMEEDQKTKLSGDDKASLG